VSVTVCMCVVCALVSICDFVDCCFDVFEIVNSFLKCFGFDCVRLGNEIITVCRLHNIKLTRCAR